MPFEKIWNLYYFSLWRKISLKFIAPFSHETNHNRQEEQYKINKKLVQYTSGLTQKIDTLRFSAFLQKREYLYVNHEYHRAILFLELFDNDASWSRQYCDAVNSWATHK